MSLTPGTRRNQRSWSLFSFEGIVARIFGAHESPSEISDIIKLADKGLAGNNAKAEAVQKKAVSSTDDVAQQKLAEAINNIINVIVDSIVLIIDAIVPL